MARIANSVKVNAAAEAAAALAEEEAKAIKNNSRKSTKEKVGSKTAAKKTAEKPAKKEKASSGEVTVEMLRFKETPGAFQYREVDDDGDVITDFKEAKIGSIYLRKDAVGENGPKKITITVAW